MLKDTYDYLVMKQRCPSSFRVNVSWYISRDLLFGCRTAQFRSSTLPNYISMSFLSFKQMFDPSDLWRHCLELLLSSWECYHIGVYQIQVFFFESERSCCDGGKRDTFCYQPTILRKMRVKKKMICRNWSNLVTGCK